MRVSTTTLESYRLWKTGDWMPESDLIATIKGETLTTPEMRLGRAYHAILEDPEQCRTLWGGYESDGIPFESSAIESMQERVSPGGVYEVKMTRDLLIPGAGPVTLVAKTDHIVGLHLDEFKTTLDAFEAEKYLASYQWRVMALLFGAQSVTYHVALLEDTGERLALKDIHSIDVYPYPRLEWDVRSLLKEFCHYVTLRGLDGLLRERQRIAESGVYV